MKLKTTLKTESLRTRAVFQPKTYDKDKRTIEVIVTTSTPVKRYDWESGTFFFEELSMKKSHIRDERLKAGLPVLNNHWSSRLEDNLGVAIDYRYEEDQLIAIVQLAERPEVSGLITDILSGVIRNVSVGYLVHTYKQLKDTVNDLAVLRAVDWEPMEISFVNIPADPRAHSRSEEKNVVEAKIVADNSEETQDNDLNMGEIMGKKSQAVETPAEEIAPVETPAAPVVEETIVETPVEETAPVVEETPTEEAPTSEGDPAALEGERALGAKLERERQIEIRKAVAVSGLPKEFGEELCGQDVTLDGARQMIFKKLEEKTNSTTFNQRVEVSNMDKELQRREAAVRGVLHKFDGQKYKAESSDMEYGKLSLLQMARHYLAERNTDSSFYKMSNLEIAKRALHTTSDFPLLLSEISNRILRDAYEGYQNTFAPFVRERSVDNFKEISSYQISNGGKLEKVQEHGEYKRTTLEESEEKYKVDKYGIILGKTWELMLADDMGAFTRIPQRLGIRARQKENETFWGIITSNPTMSETGLSLFNAGHNNFVDPGALFDTDKVGSGFEAMSQHLDLDGELMPVIPRYMVVPSALQTKAKQFLATITPNQTSQVNPYANDLQLVVEPRLDKVSKFAWYMFASAGEADMVEFAKLGGAGPEVFTREGFDVDGMETKIRYVFGMKAIDYRGFYKNKGQA